jgi:membrane protein required for colicin V production
MSYFDIVIGVIVLLLGLKGILNGFFREMFGLIGIVGGVFIASRFGTSIGQTLSDLLFHFQNKAAVNFTGFVVTLGLFWLIMVGIGFAFRQLSNISGLGPVDKVMGFVVGAGKFFLIISVVAYAFYNIKIVRTNMLATMDKSFLFPILVATGGYIMKMDTGTVQKDINATVETKQTEVENKMETSIKEKVKTSISQEIKKKAN